MMGGDHPLSKRLSLGDSVGWRLHWLICGLNRLNDRISVETGELAQPGAPVFDEVVQQFHKIQSDYSRLIWETKTMLEFDYESEVMPLFESLTKHANYLACVAETKTALAAIIDMAADNFRHKMQACLSSHH